MKELILNERMKNAQTESSLAKPNTNDDMNIELSKEFLRELRILSPSSDGEDEMLEECDNWGLDPFEVISRVNSIFEKHRRVDGTAKKLLLHSWIKKSWNKEPMNAIVSSDEEWEESDYGNPPNTTIKPYLNAQETDDIEKEDEQSQKKHTGNNNILNKAPKSDNQNNEQPSKRACKAKKFEAIKYSLGPNEEYMI
nr:hypothetical protein [Tanacetum cinerariifolium]